MKYIVALVVGYLFLCWTAEMGWVLGSIWVPFARKSLDYDWCGWVAWELPQIMRGATVGGIVALLILWLSYKYVPPLFITAAIVGGTIGMVLYRREEELFESDETLEV